MKKTNIRLRVCGVLILLNLIVIWGNSLLPGEISGAISGWVRDVIKAILRMDGLGGGTGHGLIRKCAHFMEFAVLGSLLTWRFAMVQKPKFMALLCGVLVAGADETIQRFVPGRGPSIRDVMIDTAGTLAGIGILLAGCAILKAWRTQKREKMDDGSAGNGTVGDDACLRKEEK